MGRGEKKERRGTLESRYEAGCRPSARSILRWWGRGREEEDGWKRRERERERGLFGGGVGGAREATHCDGAAHRRQPSGPTSSNRYSVTGRGRLSSLRRFFLFSSLPCDLGARANRGGRSGGKLTRRCARSSAVSRVVL